MNLNSMDLGCRKRNFNLLIFAHGNFVPHKSVSAASKRAKANPGCSASPQIELSVFFAVRSYTPDRINPWGFQNPKGLKGNFFKQLRKSKY